MASGAVDPGVFDPSVARPSHHSPDMKLVSLAFLVGLVGVPEAMIRPPIGLVTRQAVTIDHDRVSLGDLSPTVPRSLLELDIAPAPAPGRRATITRQAIRDALKRVGADESLANAMPAQQTIERAAVDLAADELRDEVVQALTARLPIGARVRSVLGVRDLTLPTGARRIDVQLGRLRAKARGTAMVYVNERLIERVGIEVVLEGTPQTPTLRANMPRGAVVQSKDVTMSPTEYHQIPPGAVIERSELVGKRLTQPGRAGTPIQRSAVKVPPVIERGQRVRVILTNHGLRITRMAIAQEDGAMGDHIRLKPTDSNTSFHGQVTSSQEVHIDLGGPR